MTTITFRDQAYQVNPGESVLDCLLREQVSIPYSCQCGVCQCCMMEAVSGSPGAESQNGLRDTAISQGRFMACCCEPDTDMTVKLPGDLGQRFATRVISVEPLNADVSQIRLQRPDDFHYHAGQLVNLYNDQGVARIYALSSVFELDDFLELQILRTPGGSTLPSVVDKFERGLKVDISQAFGDFFYLPSDLEKPLLLVGNGVALAPLYGILRDALVGHRHTGTICLLHQTETGEDAYLGDVFGELEEQYDNFNYTHCLVDESSSAGHSDAPVSDVVQGKLEEMASGRFYLCGDPAMVKSVRSHALRSGVRATKVYEMPFIVPGID